MLGNLLFDGKNRGIYAEAALYGALRGLISKGSSKYSEVCRWNTLWTR